MILADRSVERYEMVERQLAARGIRDPRVLGAMRSIPREMYLPEEDCELAYCDRAISVGYGQTISQPYIVAIMSEALQVAPHHRVLEIGTGTGYQTVLLSLLAGQVFTIERCEDLARAARLRIDHSGRTNVRFRIGDGSMGWTAHAPFDRIMVTAAAPKTPPTLFAQLAEGGRMILPIGPDGAQQLVLIERRHGELRETPLLAVRFVRLVGEEGYPD